MAEKMTYQEWLAEHLAAAITHYEELCKLDDEEYAKGGSSEYYEQALQMYGYIAALETCLKQAGVEPGTKAAAKAKSKAAAKKAPAKKKPVKKAKR